MTETEEKAVALHEYYHAIQEGKVSRAEDILAKRIKFRLGEDGRVEEYRTTNAIIPMLDAYNSVLARPEPTIDWFGDN